MAIDFRRGSGDRMNAEQYVVALREFIALPTAQTAVEQLEKLFGVPADVVQSADGGPRCPRCCGGRLGRTAIVMIRGLETAAHATFVADGAFTERPTRGPLGQNPAMVYAASQVEELLTGVLERGINRLVVVGHSWGGAIAVSLALRHYQAIPVIPSAGDIQVVSFGAPKLCTPNLAGQSAGCIDHWRFMNVGDTIPTAPMSSDDAPAMYALLAARYANALKDWCHWSQGTTMSVESVLQDTPTPPESGPWLDVSFAYFLVASASPTARNHNIDEYARRLIIWNARNPEVAARPSARGTPLPEPAAETPTKPTPPVSSSQGLTPQLAAQLSAMNPPATRGEATYAARKVGRVWVLSASGQDIARFISGRAARAMAKRLNASQGGWSQAIQGDETALAASVQGGFHSSDD